MKQRRNIDRRSLNVESLEERRVLAASVGWDGPGAGSAQLSYYIGQAPSGISQATFETAIKTALKSWSDVAAITFVQTNRAGLNNSLDFTAQAIDGSGGTLAEAYFPSDVNRGSIAGDVEFDSAEKWEIGNASGSSAFDLVLVAAHEIGHALGLDHSSNPSAVLYPSVSASQSFNGLSSADISAIRSLYAASGSSTTGTTSSGTTNTGTTGTTNTVPTPAPRFTHNSWFANWHSRFGRLNSNVEQLDSTIPTNMNLANPLDVNLDDAVSPIDALIVINLLNNHGQLTIQTNYKGDTNGDGQISPLDALIVINGLNKGSGTTQVSINTSNTGPLVTIQTDTTDPSTTDDGTDSTTDTTDSTDTSDSGTDTTVDDTTPDDSTNTGGTDAGGTDSGTGTGTDGDSDDDSDTGDTGDTDTGPHGHPRFGHGFGGGGFGRGGFGFPIVFGGGLTPERVDSLFKSFDDNADGLLTEDEVPARLWSHWVDDSVDTNNDSAVSVDEVNAAIRAKQQEKFDALDTNSDGVLSESEVSSRLWTKLTDANADTNSDGGVSLDELLAFQATIATNSGCNPNATNGTTANSATIPSNTLTQSGFAAQFSSLIRSIPRRFRG